MKERILSALKGFADETSLPEKKQASNLQLLQTITEELNLHSSRERVSVSMLRKRASRVFPLYYSRLFRFLRQYH
jgi:hypothetical protein